MFAFIRGELISFSSNHLVLEANGVGYYILIPVNIPQKLPQIGQTVLIYTAFVVREQSQALYGFLNAEEKDLFESLLNVSGIGPKLALSIIGHLSIPDLSAAVQNKDILALSKVPGIGKKTAERLAIELKDKLPQSHGALSHLTIQIPQDAKTIKIQDAMNALVNLGYNQMTAQKAIKKALGDISIEEIDLAALITLSLKNV